MVGEQEEAEAWFEHTPPEQPVPAPRLDGHAESPPRLELEPVEGVGEVVLGFRAANDEPRPLSCPKVLAHVARDAGEHEVGIVSELNRVRHGGGGPSIVQAWERPAHLELPHSGPTNGVLELGREQRTVAGLDERRARVGERLRDPAGLAEPADLEDGDSADESCGAVRPRRKRERAKAVAFREEERPAWMMEHTRAGVSVDVPAPLGAVNCELNQPAQSPVSP